MKRLLLGILLLVSSLTYSQHFVKIREVKDILENKKTLPYAYTDYSHSDSYRSIGWSLPLDSSDIYSEQIFNDNGYNYLYQEEGTTYYLNLKEMIVGEWIYYRQTDPGVTHMVFVKYSPETFVLTSEYMMYMRITNPKAIKR